MYSFVNLAPEILFSCITVSMGKNPATDKILFRPVPMPWKVFTEHGASIGQGSSKNLANQHRA